MTQRTGRLDAGIGLAFALLLVCFAALSWQKWPMLTADSARELYVPFQIRHGAFIYEDFYYLYGPVAPYLNAGLLAAFGDRLEVLYMAGLGSLGAIMAMLWLVARQVLPSGQSAAVVFLFFTHFALGRDIAGYVWPYAFAATYAVLWGLVALYALMRHTRAPHAGWLVVGGIAIGLSTVTKLEYGFAAAMLGAIFLAGRLVLGRALPDRRPWWREALCLVGPAVAVAGAIAAAVLSRVDLPTVLESVWPVELMKLWNSQSAWQGSAGSWAWNLKWVAIHAAVLGLAFGHGRLWAILRAPGPARWGLLAALGATGAIAWHFRAGLAFYLTSGHHYWMSPGFLLLFGVIGASAFAIARALRRGEALPAGAVCWGLLAAYGCLVATRTLMTGYNDYMRYQAPVALVAWVALAASWLPRAGWPGSRRAVAAMAAVAVLLGVRHGAEQVAAYLGPHEAVSSAVGTVLAPPDYAVPFNQALAYVKAHTRPGDAIVAAPMEASFYLFTGLDNVMKEDQLYYGYLTTPASQAAAIRRIEERRVRYLLVSNYGAFSSQRFGETYMADLGAWIATRCREVAAYGGEAYRIRIFETPYSLAHPDR